MRRSQISGGSFPIDREESVARIRLTLLDDSRAGLERVLPTCLIALECNADDLLAVVEAIASHPSRAPTATLEVVGVPQLIDALATLPTNAAIRWRRSDLPLFGQEIFGGPQDADADDVLYVFSPSDFDLSFDETMRRLAPVVARRSMLLVDGSQDRVDALMRCAAHGVFLQSDPVVLTGSSKQAATVCVARLRQEPFTVRHPTVDDLVRLTELERLCWPKGSRVSTQTLKKRIRDNPAGQLVLLLNGDIAACVYSQPIDTVESLSKESFDSVDRLRVSAGPIHQLLALNVDPALQNLRLGDQLLAFKLALSRADTRIEKIVGVTRCRDFKLHRGQIGNFQAYLSWRDMHGALRDPVLRMHELHGARVLRPIANYRPNDVDNDGFGVLIEYDLDALRRSVGWRDGADDTSRSRQAIADIDAYVVALVENRLTVALDPITDRSRPLMELGLDSADFLEMTQTIGRDYGVALKSTFFFEHGTVQKIIDYLRATNSLRTSDLKNLNKRTMIERESLADSIGAPVADNGTADIAVVGMACRLPGDIDSPEALWNLLMAGETAVTAAASTRWEWPSAIEPNGEHRGIEFGGFMQDVARFDAGFFGIPPADAELLDPQQRMLLEVAWSCVEHAGYSAGALRGSNTGVFIGASGSDYRRLLDRADATGEPHGGLGSSMSVVANRLSYYFDFFGPSLQIDTACSSSLIALHEAMSAIRSGQCDQALVGGINVMCDPNVSIAYYRAGMLSKAGRCRAFSQSADGYVRSEGAVLLFIKRLAAAQRDGDTIYGLLKSSAVNHGGQTSGITVPNPQRQAQLLQQAHSLAKIDPGTISYIEAHGTGTPLGDPIEIQGIKHALAASRLGAEQKEVCWIGSIKTNIGHLEAAAGAVGILKVLLSLQHRRLVANVGFDGLNPNIDLHGSSLQIVQQTIPWTTRGSSRRAGISSFGSGGANAHVLLEEFVAKADEQRDDDAPSPVIIVLSAKTMSQLQERIRQLQTYVESERICASELANVAYTLQVGRDPMLVRVAFSVADIDELRDKLRHCLNTDSSRWQELGIHHGQASRRTGRGGDLEHPDSPSPLNAWIERGDEALLRAWAIGTQIDWADLYRSLPRSNARRRRRIALPTYPFARDRYWIGTPPSSLSVCGDAEAEALLLQEEWCPMPASATSDRADTVIVLLLDDRDAQAVVVEALRKTAAHSQLVFVEHSRESPSQIVRGQPSLLEQEAVIRYQVETDLIEHCTAVLDRIRRERGAIGCVWCLWPLEQPSKSTDCLLPYRLLNALRDSGNQSTRLLLAAEYASSLERCYLESWIGYERSLGRTMPTASCAVLHRLRHHSGGVPSAEDYRWWTYRLWQESLQRNVESVHFQSDQRFVLRIKPSKKSTANPSLPFKPRSAWLVTGGLGALGYLFAEHLARRYQAQLVLTGRRLLTPEMERQIDRLRNLGATVAYYSVDVCDRDQMQAVLRETRDKYGALDGVIHAAGIAGSFAFTSDVSHAAAVLAPKVTGALVLHELLQAMPPDCIVHFSSSSALLGDFGSCDYAVANRFQLALAKYLSKNTLAICWPLWRDGGMGLEDAKATQLYLNASGQRALTQAHGVKLWEQACALRFGDGQTHLFPLLASKAVAERLVRFSFDDDLTPPLATPIDTENSSNALAYIAQCEVIDLLALQLKLPRSQIDASAGLAEYGLDSIGLAAFAKRLSAHFKVDVLPSVFFSAPTVKLVAEWLAARCRESLNRFADKGNDKSASGRIPNPRDGVRDRASPAIVRASDRTGDERIAIIGMSGRFPNARNVDEFWRLLAEERSAVAEISSERFDLMGQLSPSAQTTARCAAVPGVAEFDALFFDVSPQEAEQMDPRQRLLLQEMFLALDAAGYAGVGADKVGAYVGIEHGDYDAVGTAAGIASDITANHDGILAARLSYYLNLRGPVLAINTACSSGLVALHQACLSLQVGECDVAIAAAANLILAPQSFASLERAGFLSPDGQCFAFDRRANGTVPGEAIVAVVVKRLSDAVTDGDRIYATIAATGINHDGRTHGIAAPNGQAQVDLIVDVQRRAGVSPHDITYVIAHGTGTRLGDPVEVSALQQAFGKRANNDVQKPYCALTSIKPNVGHALAASGLVSVVAMVQSLRHRSIPASLGCADLNDYIDWESSPLFVNTHTRPWECRGKRIGAVSAFGMSGTNAHVIIEEYEGNSGATDRLPSRPGYLITMSARNERALHRRVRDLRAQLADGRSTQDGHDFAAISHTLLARTRLFECRVAMVAQGIEHALELIDRYLDAADGANIFRGKVARNFHEQPLLREFGDQLIEQAAHVVVDAERYRQVLATLGDLFCQGYGLRWAALYGDAGPVGVAVPPYSFACDRYWTGRNFRPALNEAPTKLPVSSVGISVHDDTASESAVKAELKRILGQLIKLPSDEIDATVGLADYGIDSLQLIRFAKAITERFGIPVPPSIFFRYATLAKLASHLAKEVVAAGGEAAHSTVAVDTTQVDQSQRDTVVGADEPIAIIGISGRFAGARTVDELWKILAEGQQAIEEVVTDDFATRVGRQASHTDVREPAALQRRYWVGLTPGVAEFDAQFFEVAPKEAADMDPRQRVLLHEAYWALDDAGFGPRQLDRCTLGVYVGAESGEYFQLAALQRRSTSVTANHDAMLASRLGYFLNLRGPAITLNTACSSGLVALHEACIGLRAGDCDAAVVAAVNLIVTPDPIRVMQQAGMLSPHGRCYAFDRRASGLVPGEAAVALVLKPLSRAQADGDLVHAVIRGSGINYDGRTNGVTAPSGAAQVRLLTTLYQRTSIDPRDIDFIVSHGTGTALGDSVELSSLSEALTSGPGNRSFSARCAITSIKPNIGHALAASGLASVAALVQSLRHDAIPPSLHCNEPSEHIDWHSAPLHLNADLKAWPRTEKRRIGAVSSFGMSGTNAHVLIEDYIDQSSDAPPIAHQPTCYLLAWSAKTETALSQRAADLARFLSSHESNRAASSDADLLRSLSYTLLCHGQEFSRRAAIVVTGIDDAVEMLNSIATRKVTANFGRVEREFLPNSTVLEKIDDLLRAATEKNLTMAASRAALESLAVLYCEGYSHFGERLFQSHRPVRIRVPRYPLSRDMHWFGDVDADREFTAERTPSVGAAIEKGKKPVGIRLPDITTKSPQTAIAETIASDAAPVTTVRPISDVPLDARARVQPNVAKQHLVAELIESLACALYLNTQDIELDAPFSELGLDSVIAVEWIHELNRKYGAALAASRLYDHPNINAFADFLLTQRVDTSASAEGRNSSRDITLSCDELSSGERCESVACPTGDVSGAISSPIAAPAVPIKIAIIGCAGRFPQAQDLDAFWDNIVSGRDCVTEISATRWSLERFYSADADAPGKTSNRWMGAIDDVDRFDPLFFGITPAEAEWMDPQQRLFLQECWRCIEDAGINAADLSGARCGVFVGCSPGDYFKSHRDVDWTASSLLGGAPSILSSRIAYFLNLQGPCLTIDTACSSSLVAIAAACDSLRLGHADLALAGGVNVLCGPSLHVMSTKAGMLSKTGRCYTFDERADGFVPGEGVGVLLLKRLDDALRDRDPIRAVISGWGVNQDGKTNGITAPSVAAQTRLQADVYRRHAIDPDTVSLVEAHGTGTKLGDPFELEALNQVFGARAESSGRCAIGSVKSNIGHSLAAAGVAGLMKIVLALQHKTLPPTIHFQTLNRHINLDVSPFYINTQAQVWARPSAECRRAAINSFGFSGTNAHVVVDEFSVEPLSASAPSGIVVVVLSARTAAQLQERARQLRQYVANHSFVSLRDVAYTLQVGRMAMENRLALCVGTVAELVTALDRFMDGDAAGMQTAQVKRNKDADSGKYGTADVVAATDENQRRDALIAGWLAGESVNWRQLYDHMNPPRRLSLPAYPFARERYWHDDSTISAPAMPTYSVATETMRVDSPQATRSMFLKKSWMPCPLSIPNDRSSLAPVEAIILCSDETKALAEHIAKHCRSATICSTLNQADIDLTNCDVWIDVTGCGATIDHDAAWMSSLQRWLRSRQGLAGAALCVTRGLQRMNGAANLAGADRAGLYRMLSHEYRRLRSQHMDVQAASSSTEIAQWIVAELLCSDRQIEVCYRDGVRYASTLESLDVSHAEARVGFPLDRVLLVTGGTRGIGLLCATHFARRHGVRRIALLGRETLPPRQQWDEMLKSGGSLARKLTAILELESLGVRIHVSTPRLDDRAALQRCIRTIQLELGPIGGVLHCAGSIDTDNPALVSKHPDEIRRTLSPKIQGVDNLLAVTGSCPLQFLVLFSSVSAVAPSLASGQSVYALANSYMDHVAEANAQLLPIKSIQWPSWRDVGMGAARTVAYARSGLQQHSNAEGLDMLDRVLAHVDEATVLPAIVRSDEFVPADLLVDLRADTSQDVAAESVATAVRTKPAADVSDWQTWFRTLVVNELKIPADRLDTEVPLSEYGVDSIMLAQLLKHVSREVGTTLDPSIIFEYPSIAAFADWLDRSFAGTRTLAAPSIEQTEQRSIRRSSTERHADIAIVGIACRVPGATDADEFWRLLIDGQSAIGTVPAVRWPHSTTRYAGMLDSVNRFALAQLKLSPADALALGAQTLMLLEETHNLIRHAGYAADEVRGHRIGVYVGARAVDDVGGQAADRSRARMQTAGQNYLAATISRQFDWHGPSLVVDTACSSGLVAASMAMHAIRACEIDSAVVGGISLLTDESTHQSFQQRGILSAHREFHLFDRRANGAVLGEGVGMVWLKSMTRAMADRDRIYAVIKGLAVNNDGQTAGPAAPNFAMMRDVMLRALAQSGHRPDEVAYIEANASGSEVTDLLELKAISSVYRSESRAPCELGSMKPNIGHPLCAEGVLSLIKAALTLHHRRCVPFLSALQPMGHFDLAASPFYFAKEATPVGSGPSLAAVNCFADGGTNAHVVLKRAVESEQGKRMPLQPIEWQRSEIGAQGLSPVAIATDFWELDATEYDSMISSEWEA